MDRGDEWKRRRRWVSEREGETRWQKHSLAVLLIPPLFLEIEEKKVETKPWGLADFFLCLWRLAKPQKLLTSRFNSMFLETFWSSPTFSLLLHSLLSFIGHGKYSKRPNRLCLVATETFVPETFSLDITIGFL